MNRIEGESGREMEQNELCVECTFCKQPVGQPCKLGGGETREEFHFTRTAALEKYRLTYTPEPKVGESGLGDEQFVKQEYPDSYAYKWGGWRDGEDGWTIARDRAEHVERLGSGTTEARAWSNARAHIEAKPSVAPQGGEEPCEWNGKKLSNYHEFADIHGGGKRCIKCKKEFLASVAESVAPPSLPTLNTGLACDIQEAVLKAASGSHMDCVELIEKLAKNIRRTAVPVAPLSEDAWITKMAAAEDGAMVATGCPAEPKSITGEGSELPAPFDVLKAAALKAQKVSPGPWFVIERHGEPRYVVRQDKPDDDVEVDGHWGVCQPDTSELTEYIAAASPDVILKLIEKSALSSPQQEPAEFVEAKKLLVEAVTMRNSCVAAEQNSGSEKVAERYGKQADEIFYRILEFNKRTTP